LNGTDWQDLLFPGGAMYNAHVNISGGSEKATYSVSLDYFDEKGVVPSTFYKRYSFRNNLDFELSKKIKVGTSMSLVRDGGKGTSFNGDRPENSILLAAMSHGSYHYSDNSIYTTFPDTLSLVPVDHEFYSANDSLAWMNTPRGNTGNPISCFIQKWYSIWDDVD
jgi:hypothetical protein